MTSADSSDRDELVAAYLDGEATPEERALVEGDADLMERALVLREVADLIAEPVLVPTPEVRNGHIAAALAASSTAPNVTALAPRRRQWPADYTAALGAAAAIIVVLFAGTLLLTNVGGDDDDTAAGGVNDAATEEFDVFDSADEGGDVEQEALATTDGGDAGSSADDADVAEAEAAEAEMAAEPAAEEEMAEEEMAEEDAADDAGETAAAEADAERTDGSVASVTRDIEPALVAPTIGALADQIGLILLDGDALFGTGNDVALNCEQALDDSSRGFLDPLVAGEANVASQPVEYVVVDNFGESLLIVVDTATCFVIGETPLP